MHAPRSLAGSAAAQEAEVRALAGSTIVWIGANDATTEGSWEWSGISEPLPVAETFTFKDAAGTSRGAIAKLDKPGLEGCYCHPRTPWLGRSEFTGSTAHYYG